MATARTPKPPKLDPDGPLTPEEQTTLFKRGGEIALKVLANPSLELALIPDWFNTTMIRSDPPKQEHVDAFVSNPGHLFWMALGEARWQGIIRGLLVNETARLFDSFNYQYVRKPQDVFVKMMRGFYCHADDSGKDLMLEGLEVWRDKQDKRSSLRQWDRLALALQYAFRHKTLPESAAITADGIAIVVGPRDVASTMKHHPALAMLQSMARGEIETR